MSTLVGGQDDSASDESESIEDQVTTDVIQDDQGQSTCTRASLHVSVQRDEIASVQICEGNEELQGLGVDVYDQQAYEKSVFSQVDKAITEVSANTKQAEPSNDDNPNGAPINDLMRLIHDGQEQDSQLNGDHVEHEERDEQILLLARQQRLNRIQIKKEVIESSIASLPRCPRLPRVSNLSETPQPSTSRQQHPAPGTSCKQEISTTSNIPSNVPIQNLVSSDDDNDDDVNNSSSSHSEYNPKSENDNESDLDDEQISNYETDEEAGPPRLVGYDSDEEDDLDESNASRRSRKEVKVKDDGDFKAYAKRVKAYAKSRASRRLENISEDGTELRQLDEMITIDGNLQMPKDIWDNLYEHQKTGVRWLWELHQLGTGGILGDEMGLGKTIQMIAFLVALKCSNIVNLHNCYENLGPVVLVCPATVMHQWLIELRKWYPPFRVAILHSTGSFAGDRKQLIKVIHKSNGILICSYPGVVIYQDYLHALDWHYAILDEGHKIRNPDAQVTLASKRFRTPHRIILSGSPVQNNLRELWSIFDFIYPGKLGTLPVFMNHFGVPITQGGYANASDVQVQIAYKCACVLRDTIKPFLLRRTKAEVGSKLKLPERSEQVLFCKLTDKQRRAYEAFLQSPTVRDIKRGTLQIFVGLIQLRKICNHPDLFDATDCTRQVRQSQKFKDQQIRHLEFFSTDETYGHQEKSGKMMVVDALLKLWKKQQHKVLLFTQSRQMLKIFTKYLDNRQYKYLFMDGSTPIGTRHTMIDKFNDDNEIFIFLLTTRVGGVGVNLIGANRIIIYDPDWNPSTDIQARERAWRIGQKRQVIIYRLLTAGTIEEKIYHRQVFKLYLTNRILRDAKQKRLFKTNDMHELFTLGTDDKNIETQALFDEDLQIDKSSLNRSKDRGTKKRRMQKEEKKKRRRVSRSDENSPEPGARSGTPVKLSEEKLREMRERAKRLSAMIAAQYGEQQQQQQQSLAGATNEQTQSSRSHIRIKIERNENGFLATSQTEESQVGCRLDRQRATHNGEMNDNDPTQAVPYCPAFNLPKQPQKPAVVCHEQKRPSKQRVDYLVKQDVYKHQSDTARRDGGGSQDDYQRDDYILSRLFKNSNISGALKHDRIESDSTADYKVVESEAEKVARDAIRVLRESRRLCLGSTSGIPNWTGRNGQLAATANQARPRLIPRNRVRAHQLIVGNHQSTVSPSSSTNNSLLSSIRKRNQVNPVSLQASANNGEQLDTDDEAERDRDFRGKAQDMGADQMAKRIRDFVLYQSAISGEAQTDELLGYFKHNFDPKQTAVFKAILYKICELQRRGDKGFWRLKTEFRDVV